MTFQSPGCLLWPLHHIADLSTQVAMCWCPAIVTSSLFSSPLVCSPVSVPSPTFWFSLLLSFTGWMQLPWAVLKTLYTFHSCVCRHLPLHGPLSLGLLCIPAVEIPLCFYCLPIRWGPSISEIPGQLGFWLKDWVLKETVQNFLLLH